MSNLKYNFYTPDNRLISSDYLIEIVENNLHCFDEYDLLKNKGGYIKGHVQINNIYLKLINEQTIVTYKGWTVAEHLYQNIKVVKRYVRKHRNTPTQSSNGRHLKKPKNITKFKESNKLRVTYVGTLRKISKSNTNAKHLIKPYYLKSPNNLIFIGVGLTQFVKDHEHLFNKDDLNKTYTKQLNTDNKVNKICYALASINNKNAKSWKGWTRLTDLEIQEYLKQTYL